MKHVSTLGVTQCEPAPPLENPGYTPPLQHWKKIIPPYQTKGFHCMAFVSFIHFLDVYTFENFLTECPEIKYTLQCYFLFFLRNVWFQKISTPTPRMVIGNSKGGGGPQ